MDDTTTDLRERVAALEAENEELRQTVQAQESRMDALTKRLDVLQEDLQSAGNGHSAGGPTPHGLSQYATPAYEALVAGLEPHEVVSRQQVQAAIKRETQASNPNTVDKYTKEITKRGPFSPVRGSVGVWTYTPGEEGEA